METVADRLQSVRAHFKWSKADLARECEVTRQAVGKWLNEGAVPDTETLRPLRKKHRVNENWILYREGEMIIASADSFMAEVRDSAPLLDETDRQSVLAVIRNLVRKNDESRPE